MVADIARASGRRHLLFADPGCEAMDIDGIPVLREEDGEVHARFSGHAEFIAAVGARVARARLNDIFSGKLAILVHPRATLSSTARLSEGVVVMAGAVINGSARLGAGVIVNSGAIVEHDACIGAATHLAPGSVCCGGVGIGSRCDIGAGATLIPTVSVADDVIVGAGATVISPIMQPGVYVGSPARRVSASA